MDGNDEETTEVMNCLLSLSQIQTNQGTDYHYWPNGNYAQEIIWKVEDESEDTEQINKTAITYILAPNTIKEENPPIQENNVVFIQTIQEQMPESDGDMVLIPRFPQQYTFVKSSGYDTNPEPSSSKTDSSYSDCIDVERDDSDGEEPLLSFEDITVTPVIKAKRALKGKKKLVKKTTKSVKKESPLKSNSKEKSTSSKVTESKSESPQWKNNKDDELTKLEDNWQQVAAILEVGCECSVSCYNGLNPEKVFRHRLNIADLTKAEHDMYLMGVILASIQNPEETCRRKERLRLRTSYSYHGKKVCLQAFLYLEHVTLYQLKRLRNHVQNHGVTPRIHGNHGRKPSNTLSFDTYQHGTDFVNSLIKRSDVKAVIGPGKVISYRLPTHWSRKTVHEEYKRHCHRSMPSTQVMRYSSFIKFFKKQFPQVKFGKANK